MKRLQKRWALIAFAVASGALAQGPAAPPIPHPIDGYLVIREENNCLECHDKPRDIGKKRAKGQPLPAPATHYAKAEGKPEIADGHFICTSCHKPK
jgi:nitrate reductase cytochrome c-type subunit